jgi:hypothetical protein
MLIVNARQMEALTRPSRERFENALVQHLWTAWPRECRLTGSDAALLNAVRQIIQVAHANGYETSRELTLYAKLVFSLGIRFDTDPQLDWAATALFDESIENSTERIERLYDETVDYLGEIGGEDSGRVVRALLRVRRYDFAAAPTSTGEEHVEDLCEILGTFWPEKLAFQETSPTLAMIRACIEKAGRYGITDPMGRCVFATTAYFFGHEFDVDPLQPWAMSVVNDPSFGDGEARSRALLQAGLNRVAQSLARE